LAREKKTPCKERRKPVWNGIKRLSAAKKICMRRPKRRGRGVNRRGKKKDGCRRKKKTGRKSKRGPKMKT